MCGSYSQDDMKIILCDIVIHIHLIQFAINELFYFSLSQTEMAQRQYIIHMYLNQRRQNKIGSIILDMLLLSSVSLLITIPTYHGLHDCMFYDVYYYINYIHCQNKDNSSHFL